jgi:hypothetical protein
MSSNAQYVTLQKYFSYPSLVIYLFPTPPIELKLGLQIGGRLVIAKHLDQSQTGSSSQITFITLFSSRCSALLCHLPTLLNSTQMLRNKTILLSEVACFDFLHPILMYRVTYWALVELLLDPLWAPPDLSLMLSILQWKFPSTMIAYLSPVFFSEQSRTRWPVREGTGYQT